MLLYLDTETSGLPDFNKRARDPAQPHIVQMAAILTDDLGGALEEHNVIIKPDGWTIPKEASDVHGITDETAAIGIPEKLAAEILLAMIRKSQLLIGHNIQFDKFIARIAMRRFELITDADDAAWKSMPTFCTMKSMTPICKIPPTAKMVATGRTFFKSPKLQEAYQTAFGKPFEKAHDALADLRACKDIYFWLKARKV
jgi:DNA polymerase-3 subunit epsilon